MVAIPTVKSCCGCCDLRISCIVMAILRLIAYIVSVLAYLYFVVFLEIVLREEKNRRFRYEQLEPLIKLSLFVVSVNIYVTIAFIIGVRSKNAAKMEYYVIAVWLNALLFVFLFEIVLLVYAVVECYILLCSYSLYMEYKNSCQEAAMHCVYTTVNTVIKDENEPLPETSKTPCLTSV